jgi:hypothetical protein
VNLILSELCIFVNTKWLQLEKYQFMTIHICIFIKKVPFKIDF